jgi:hypothetical protein
MKSKSIKWRLGAMGSSYKKRLDFATNIWGLPPRNVSFGGLGRQAGRGCVSSTHDYRGISLIRKSTPLGLYSRNMPRALWGGGRIQVCRLSGPLAPGGCERMEGGGCGV